MKDYMEIKRIHEDAILPTYGSDYAAGMDLYAYTNGETIAINPGQTVKIGSGVAIHIPLGYFGALAARSGLSIKEGLRPANCLGVVDCDYRGEVIAALHNDSDVVRYVEHGQRIAQLMIIPYKHVELKEVEELTSTKRGAGGFGSTGK